MAGAAAAALVSSVLPLLVRQIVDDLLAPAGTAPAFGGWLGALAGLAVLRYTMSVTGWYTAGRLSLAVAHDLRADLHAALLRLDSAARDALATGQVVSRASTDLSYVQGLLVTAPGLGGNLLLFALSMVVMTVLCAPLALVAVAVAPALWILADRSRRTLLRTQRAALQQAGELVGDVDAAVVGVRVVRGFGQEGRELRRLELAARRLFTGRMQVVRAQARYGPALQTVPGLGLVGIVLLGGWLALHGRVTLGTFLAFTAYLGQLVGPVRQMMTLLTMYQLARAGVERVFEIIDRAPRATDPRAPVPLALSGLDLRLEDIRFGYGGTPVLDGLSLSVAAGETVAVVGPSGAGKSTIVALLARQYDPERGTVRLGGVDLRRVSRAESAARVACVFQESFLFSGTVRETIAYARPEATDAQVRAAARAAGAGGFISALPDGYDSRVGERGLTLSGGQRQRLALARALLADAPVLVLDDVTSAVDPRTEADICAALRHRAAGRTVLLITQRRAMLALADRVVVLAHGRVADSGTLAELESHSPHFRSLFGAPGLDPGEWLPPRPGGPRAPAGALDPGPTSHPGEPPGPDAGSAPGAASPWRGAARIEPPPGLPEAVLYTHEPLNRFTSLLAPVHRALAVGVLLVGVETAAQLAVPALVRTGVDRGVLGGSLPALVAVAATALTMLLAAWACGRSAVLVTGRTGERLLYLVRVRTFAHMQRIGLEHYVREPGGRIMSRITTDVDALAEFLQTAPAVTMVSLLTLVSVLLALVALDGGLALVLVAILPVLLGATVLFRAGVAPAYADARDRLAALTARLREHVAGLTVMHSFGRDRIDHGRFVAASRGYVAARLHAHRYTSMYVPFVQLLADLAGVVVLGVGAARLRDGSLTPGVLIAFFLYLDAFFAPAQQLTQVFDGYRRASVGLSRIRELLYVPAGTPSTGRATAVRVPVGEVRLCGVWFSYPGAACPALCDLNLTVRPGETVALIGETGAGKSTVLDLVARFYDPTAGAVLVDGADLRTVDLAGYRRRLGVVPQEPYLCAGTIRDAIAYGRPDATDAEVEAAARAVGAHDMIAGLAGGYRHRVSERGGDLSVGQRQLVALARAELVDPDVLLLDEATSALDPAGDTVVAAAIARLTRRRTTLVIAHRPATAARAGRIAVLHQGRVVQIGSHQELLSVGGRYADFWAGDPSPTGRL